MKKSLIVGMLIACAFQVSFAAPVRNAAEVKRTMTDEISRNNEKAAAAAQGRTGLSRLIYNTANTLSRVVRGVNETDLRAAMNRKVVIKEANGDRTVDLLDVGQAILKADQGLRKLNRNELDANGKAHLETLEAAIQTATEFLALASRTSDMKPEALMTPQEKLEVTAFNEQLALIPDILTKMDLGPVDPKTGKREAGALDTHIAAMKGAVAAHVELKRSATKEVDVTGDKAFAAQMKKGKSQEEYLAKLNELINCAK